MNRRKLIVAIALAVAPKPGIFNPYSASASQGTLPQTQAGLAQVNWSDLKQLTIQLPQGIVNLSADEVWAALTRK